MEIRALVDTGAGTSAISNELRENLNIPIIKKSNVVLRIADGKSIASLGIAELEVEIDQGVKIPLEVEVIDSKQRDLILGTNLLKHGIIDMGKGLLTIRMNNREYEIPIDCERRNKGNESSSESDDTEEDELEDSEESDETESESDEEYEEGNEEELFTAEQSRKNKKSAK